MSIGYLQLLLLVSANDFEFVVDDGGLGQVEGVGRHRREGAGGPSRPAVHAEGRRAVAGRGRGPERRGVAGRRAARARRRGGEPGRVAEDLPVGGRGVAVRVAHLGP